MFDKTEDNVVLQPRETLHEYHYEDAYGNNSTDYLVYNPITLTITVYEREFKYSCYLLTLTRRGLKAIAYSEWRRYLKQVFDEHQ